ncbi:MAG: adenosine deaminase [Armatimonadetes bacterium]|nr:adenosine deaminase [Armatimonadota bacterium]
MTALRALLNRLPKAELHVHLRGAMPPATFLALLGKYGCRDLTERAPARLLDRWRRADNLAPLLAGAPVGEESVRRLFCYRDFDNFLATFAFTGFFVRELDDFRLLVDSVLDDLASQGIVYAEVTVSLREYLNQGLALEALLEVLERATVPGLRVAWIADLVRNFGVKAAEELVERLATLRSPAVVGITLGGSEHEYPPAPFARAYAHAAEAGLRLSVHAGEALGPASVRDALADLGVERVGHGIRAIEDGALVALLARAAVPLEVCPTSNLCTGVVSSLASHPVKELLEAGVPLSINTDDPTFFGTTLVDEYLAVASLGVSREALLELVRNGFRHAFLPAAERDAYLTRLDACLASNGPRPR